VHIEARYFSRDIMNVLAPLEFGARFVECRPGDKVLSINYERPPINEYMLARALANAFDPNSKAYFSVLSSPVWQSSQDWFLINLVLAEIGMSKENYVGARVTFDCPLDERFVGLVHCALLFGWDAIVYQKPGPKTAICSHDGEVFLFGVAQELILAEIPEENISFRRSPAGV